MAEIKLNIEINGTLDADIIAQEVNYHVRRELEKIKASEPKPLKVGDYAKVVAKDSESNGCSKQGDIVIITEVDSYRCPYGTEHLNGKSAGWHYPYDLVKATDEEVSEFKLAEKWAKIGRKPSEFKKGDIITVGDNCGAPFEEGSLIEVNYAISHKSVVVTGGWAVVVGELITPVEARFDA